MQNEFFTIKLYSIFCVFQISASLGPDPRRLHNLADWNSNRTNHVTAGYEDPPVPIPNFQVPDPKFQNQLANSKLVQHPMDSKTNENCKNWLDFYKTITLHSITVTFSTRNSIKKRLWKIFHELQKSKQDRVHRLCCHDMLVLEKRESRNTGVCCMQDLCVLILCTRVCMARREKIYKLEWRGKAVRPVQ